MRESSLWILHKIRCEGRVFCFVFLGFWGSEKTKGPRKMAPSYATPFSSQCSKQTIWSSLILVFSLLFSTLSPLTLKSRSIPTLLIFCLPGDAHSDVCFPVFRRSSVSFSWARYNRTLPGRTLLPTPNSSALRWFALWDSASLTTKPAFPKPFLRQRLQTGRFQAKALSQFPAVLFDPYMTTNNWVGQHFETRFLLKNQKCWRYWELPSESRAVTAC